MDANLIEQLKAEQKREAAKKRNRLPRIRFWDCRYQYDPDKGFRPRFGNVFEVWAGIWGEPRLQIGIEAGHRRFWHRPRVYDLNSDCTQWVKSISGMGFCLAVAVRPLRQRRA